MKKIAADTDIKVLVLYSCALCPCLPKKTTRQGIDHCCRHFKLNTSLTFSLEQPYRRLSSTEIDYSDFTANCEFFRVCIKSCSTSDRAFLISRLEDINITQPFLTALLSLAHHFHSLHFSSFNYWVSESLTTTH